jgi:hypothetical protein
MTSVTSWRTSPRLGAADEVSVEVDLARAPPTLGVVPHLRPGCARPNTASVIWSATPIRITGARTGVVHGPVGGISPGRWRQHTRPGRCGQDGRPGDARPWRASGAEQASQTFEQAVGRIRPAAQALITQLRALAHVPDEVQVEFGLELSAEARAYIASASTSANFKVSLAWHGVGPAGMSAGAGATDVVPR